MHSRQPTSLVISRHYCFLKFILLNDDSLKNFRESYVFHCLVIKVLCLSKAHLFYHCHFRLSRTFLSFFKLFKWLFVIRRCISNSFTLSHPVKNVNKFFHFLLTFLKVSKRKIRFISKRIKLYHYAFSASSVFY